MKICIFYTSPKLGDLILQLPFIKAISEKYNSKVSICINKHLGFQNILRSQKYIDDVIESYFRRGTYYISDIYSLSQQLKKKKFEIAFILEKTKGPALASILAGIKIIYGFGIGTQKFFVNKKIRLKKNDLRFNYTEQSIKFCNQLDIKFNFEDKFLVLEQSDTNITFNRYKDFPKPWVCFGVDSTEKNRIWPQENFSQLADKLINSNLAKTIFVINSQNYDDYFNNILLKSNYKKNFVDCKNLNRSEIIQLIYLSNYFVGIDSGPSCVAGAFQKETFCIIGATDKTLPRFKSMNKIISNSYNKTREVGIVRCGDNFAQNNNEVKLILVDQVFDEIKKIAEKKDITKL